MENGKWKMENARLRQERIRINLPAVAWAKAGKMENDER
jgi:hypothetical protein